MNETYFIVSYFFRYLAICLSFRPVSTWPFGVLAATTNMRNLLNLVDCECFSAFSRVEAANRWCSTPLGERFRQDCCDLLLQSNKLCTRGFDALGFRRFEIRRIISALRYWYGTNGATHSLRHLTGHILKGDLVEFILNDESFES